jgi:electron transport complex protein RnfE
VSGIEDRILLLSLCPLIAITDTLIEGLAAALILLGLSSTAAAIFLFIRRWLTEELELPAAFILYALLIAIVELVLLAWAPRLRLSLAVFLPLMVCSFGVLIGWLHQNESSRAAMSATLRICALSATALIVLGSTRELVGHGSLFHGAAVSFGPHLKRLEWTAFDFDMGFLLAMLPPGAFIALGLLLALRNAWQARR